MIGFVFVGRESMSDFFRAASEIVSAFEAPAILKEISCMTFAFEHLVPVTSNGMNHMAFVFGVVAPVTSNGMSCMTFVVGSVVQVTSGGKSCRTFSVDGVYCCVYLLPRHNGRIYAAKFHLDYLDDGGGHGGVSFAYTPWPKILYLLSLRP
jgi:hypothetical protein